MNRREFIRSLIVTAALVGTAGVGLLEIGNLVENNQNKVSLPTIQQSSSQQATSSESSNSATTQVSSNSTIPTGYSLIASLSQLSGKSYAYFTHPTFGSSILVSVGGQWKAFSATCTHRPCTVQYQSSSIYCPCHGGTFNPNNGNVEGGPPPTPLPEYSVLIQNNNLYVGDTQIN
jgi:Rieske Fe-S protein